MDAPIYRLKDDKLEIEVKTCQEFVEKNFANVYDPKTDV